MTQFLCTQTELVPPMKRKVYEEKGVCLSYEEKGVCLS